MHHQHRGGGGATGRGGRGGGRGSANKKEDHRWWRKTDPATVDPITLEPIREFKIEPFQIGKTLFDGEMLAHYLVSTAVFAHPTTREKITREDCVRLDDHLRNKLSTHNNSYSVVDAYDLLHSASALQATARRKEQTEAMRREATLLFQHLFTFRSNRHRTRPKHSAQQQGLTVIDDDDDMFFSHESTLPSALDFERDFPELFPVLAAAAESASSQHRLVTPTPRGGGHVRGRIPSPVVVEEEEDLHEEEVPLFDIVEPPVLEEAEEEEASAHISTEEVLVQNEEEERHRLEVERELRLAAQAKQQRRPPRPSVRNLPKAKASVKKPPVVVTPPTTMTPSSTKDLTASALPNRRFIDPVTHRGPCWMSILGTVLALTLFFLALLFMVERTADESSLGNAVLDSLPETGFQVHRDLEDL